MFAEAGTYDEIITVFSPDGRLLQVEYAFEAVNRGATVLGISCSDGIVLGAQAHVQAELQDADFCLKVHKVDEHLGVAIAGLTSDGRILIDQARIYAQINRLMYDEPMDVEALTKRIGNIKQAYTQYGWVRPFGVSFIFGGVDKTGNKLFATEPSGSYRAYRAVAEGAGREVAEDILKEEYHEHQKLDATIKLAIRCLLKAIETKGEKSTVSIAVIPSETKRFRMLTSEEVEPFIRRGGRRSRDRSA